MINEIIKENVLINFDIDINENGKEHVYYEYPEHFGTTPKRASSKRPEGPQSHCESCRFNRGSYPKAILCSEIDR